MNLSIIDKKCTLDYLDELVPLQRKLLGHILNGKVLTIKSQIETIQHTIDIRILMSNFVMTYGQISSIPTKRKSITVRKKMFVSF